MTHPYSSSREDKAGSARAKQFIKGYAKGGSVSSAKPVARKAGSSVSASDIKVEGRASGGRLDRKPRKFEKGGPAIKRYAEGGRGIINRSKPNAYLGGGGGGGGVGPGSPKGKIEASKDVKNPDKIEASKDAKNPDWMKGLSEKDIATTLGSTSLNPISGMREHKKGGAVDKFARGGKAKRKKGGNNVNIAIVAPRGKGDAPIAQGLLPPPGAGLPPGLPAGEPPDMSMGPPPGMLPKRPMGPPGEMPPGMMKRGGKVYKGGGESGRGRLEKKSAYGLKPLKAS